MKLFSAFRSMSTLSIALGVSVAIHAALLTVRFVTPEQFNRVFQDTPLEVILVNAHTQERPEKPRPLPRRHWPVAVMRPRVAPPARCPTRH